MLRIPTRRMSTAIPAQSMFNSQAPAATAARRGGVKWAPAVLAVAGIGYGVLSYREAQLKIYREKSAQLEKEDLERRRRNLVLMEAYGDGSRLEDLEKAVELYDTQHGR